MFTGEGNEAKKKRHAGFSTQPRSSKLTSPKGIKKKDDTKTKVKNSLLDDSSESVRYEFYADQNKLPHERGIKTRHIDDKNQMAPGSSLIDQNYMGIVIGSSSGGKEHTDGGIETIKGSPHKFKLLVRTRTTGLQQKELD